MLPELLVILVIVLIIFGAGKLRGVGGAVGKSIRDFKEAMRVVPGDRYHPEERARRV